MRQSRQATRRARELRRAMTEAEVKRWQHLRGGQLKATKFRRQVPVGGFIADFCCRNPKLVVEVDGGQHAATAQQDVQRTRVLTAQGYAVLRFWNDDILTNIDGVLEAIAHEVAVRKAATLTLPSPTLRKRAGEDTFR